MSKDILEVFPCLQYFDFTNSNSTLSETDDGDIVITNPTFAPDMEVEVGRADGYSTSYTGTTVSNYVVTEIKNNSTGPKVILEGFIEIPYNISMYGFDLRDGHVHGDSTLCVENTPSNGGYTSTSNNPFSNVRKIQPTLIDCKFDNIESINYVGVHGNDTEIYSKSRVRIGRSTLLNISKKIDCPYLELDYAKVSLCPNFSTNMLEANNTHITASRLHTRVALRCRRLDINDTVVSVPKFYFTGNELSLTVDGVMFEIDFEIDLSYGKSTFHYINVKVPVGKSFSVVKIQPCDFHMEGYNFMMMVDDHLKGLGMIGTRIDDTIVDDMAFNKNFGYLRLFFTPRALKDAYSKVRLDSPLAFVMKESKGLSPIDMKRLLVKSIHKQLVKFMDELSIINPSDYRTKYSKKTRIMR